MSFPDRLKRAVKYVGTATTLAKRAHMSDRSIRRYIKSGQPPSDDIVARLADAAGVRFEWLLKDEGPMLQGKPAALRAEQRTSPDYGVEAGPTIRGRVPRISPVEAGKYKQFVDNFQPGQADEWIETTVPVQRHTYALRVDGDSMTNPDGIEPTFPHGTVIVVEPDAVGDPSHMVGRFVIVRRAGTEETTFKQLTREAGRFFLRPLNPKHAVMELNADDVFCGVVRQKVVRFF